MNRRTFVRKTSQTAMGFGILRYAAACRPAGTGDDRFAELRDRYFVRTLELNPVTSTYLGGDGYSDALAGVNGRLRDFSPDGIATEVAFYRDTVRELERFDPDSLSEADRIDHTVMGAQIAYMLRQLDQRRYHERCLDTYVAEPFRGVDWQMQQMQTLEGGLLGTEDEWALVVSRVRAVPQYLDVARGNLLAGKAAGNRPDWRMVEEDGITASRAAAEYFSRTLGDTARGYLGARPFAARIAADIDAAGRSAADAFEAFAGFLERELDPGDRTDRYAAGEEEYAWRVRHCLQDTRTPAELYEYGAAQVALYEHQIFTVAEEVAREAGLGLSFATPPERRASVRAVMEHLSTDSPTTDDELLGWYRDAAARAVAYGREHGLFDIPADYRLDIVPTPPVLQGTIGAAYYPAPPFKTSGVGRFYLSPTGNDPAALRENNRASVADTAVHEGFPGHDWHFKYMTLHAAEISPIRWLTPGAVEDSFSMWEDSMASEGWALYSEELMAEPVADRPHGFYSAGDYLYELQGQLLRAVRVRVDVGIHTGRMTFDEAVDYFAEHVSFYPGACARAGGDATARAICDGARKSMYRYSKWPTQAITYNLGKNAIVGLREAYREKLGADYSPTTFHERFMAMGTIPAGYFRSVFLERA
ncbi:MAG: DUF885 domain-containing protein [Gemmatimonadota bacterium]|nr:DUF885 domain-containing protein [Gemmatimonadota bacterium]MDH3367555.1 DUF885 domain-containing protein [Gemmatimonadota bacterium]MDH3479336.1 DUF885 domain-containing protein [Gemmatimonadota bacterium]MDH3569467.1 DUF885 domain-containing protein [Gemmatimonadota bacterium]MDH5550959.1 DUF885 domain-containing protein [Gemmatimonadota bacterium]